MVSRILTLFGVYLAFGALIAVFKWYPGYEFRYLLFPSPELAVIWMVLAGIAVLREHISLVPRFLLSIITTLLLLFSIAEAFTQFNFEHTFVPWTDLRYIPDLLIMVSGSQIFGSTPVLIVAGLLLCLISAIGLYLLFRRIEVAMRQTGVLCLLPILLLLPEGLAVGYRPVLTGLALRQLHPPSEVVVGPELVLDKASNESELSTGPKTSYYFSHLKERNVFLFIVESYGHTLFSNPTHYSSMAPFYPTIERELDRAGYKVLSHFLDSPITGGRSWLAEATLLTGVRAETQYIYDTLVDQTTWNLTHDFQDAGYYSILAAPGITKTGESWKAFSVFDRYLIQENFGYRGPHFAFGAMPDQFLLNYVRKEILARDHRRPFFMQLILVTSHTPFNMTPAYLDNWDEIGDGSEYRTLPNRQFKNNWLTGGEYPEGYTHSIQYVLTSISDFLVKYVDDDSLIIIVGDHQPRFPIRERGSSKSVPIHIISRDGDLIRPFERFGYTWGLEPQQLPPHPGMETFYPNFLRVIFGLDEQPPPP